MHRRWHIMFSGRVQGVGFRYTCVQCSKHHSVSGWVKNIARGDVEMIVEGDPPTLQSYVADVEASTHGQVREKSVVESAATGEFSEMAIRH